MTNTIGLSEDNLEFIRTQMVDIGRQVGRDPSEWSDGDWRWGMTVEIRDESGHLLGTVSVHGDGWWQFHQNPDS